MRFTTWPNSQRPVFAAMGRPIRLKGPVVIDEAFLAAFGELTLPGTLWRTMLRLILIAHRFDSAGIPGSAEA
jgi:hypothetical protein